MSTTLQKPQEVERRWYIIDAANKPVGRTAALVATLLRGKHKGTFTPNVDCGDHVIVINCKDAVFTGKKLDQKMYYRHSAYVGGLKSTTARQMMDSRPEYAMYLAVKGMLPANTLGRKALTRLRAYAGAEHNNAAQKPVVYEG
ncbi:MAG: 50S ribosomal protein L13 [Oscillospiraceae bacterium]|nr:50S ribosomal protein L13 [Oscillospiraceae bacterium]